MTLLKKPASDCILNFISRGCSGDCTKGKCSCLKAGLTCSDICKNCIGGECLNLKTLSPESADSLDDDVLDDALQAFNDDSDTETLAGKIKYKIFFMNLLFFANKFFNVVFFRG